MQSPQVATSNMDKNSQVDLTSPISVASPSSLSSESSPISVTPRCYLICSPRKAKPAWFFRSYHLHPAEWHRNSRMATVSAATQPDDHFVVFTTLDDVRVVVPRPLLEASGGPLCSLAGARLGNASIRSLVLYDDFSVGFSALSRFLACSPIDLSPCFAPMIAITAMRWKIFPLAAACFASFEPLYGYSAHPVQSDDNVDLLQAWPSILASWMPVLDTLSLTNSVLLPFRFAALLSRRIALALSHLFPLIQKCRRCTADVVPIDDRNLTDSCSICATLPVKSEGLWHILWRRGLLREVLYIAIRLGGMGVTATLAYVILMRLSDVMSEDETVDMLKSCNWVVGLSHATLAASQPKLCSLVDAWNTRAWRIMARVMSDHASQSGVSGASVASAALHVRNVRTGRKDGRLGVCASGDPWGVWETHVAVAWSSNRVCKDNLFSDDTAFDCSLHACVRVRSVEGALIKGEDEFGRVEVEFVMYTAGCSCEMGCVLDQISVTNLSELLGDRHKVITTTWKKLRTVGVVLTLLNHESFATWAATHSDDCGLFIMADVRTPRVATASYNSALGNVISRNNTSPACHDKSSSDTEESQENRFEGTEDDTATEPVCACSRCFNY